MNAGSEHGVRAAKAQALSSKNGSTAPGIARPGAVRLARHAIKGSPTCARSPEVRCRPDHARKAGAEALRQSTPSY
jgi:hypothetical protein